MFDAVFLLLWFLFDGGGQALQPGAGISHAGSLCFRSTTRTSCLLLAWSSVDVVLVAVAAAMIFPAPFGVGQDALSKLCRTASLIALCSESGTIFQPGRNAFWKCTQDFPEVMVGGTVVEGTWVTAILFGVSSAMLGVSGFESSSQFVEEQAKGVFVKTLRNMQVSCCRVKGLRGLWTPVCAPV